MNLIQVKLEYLKELHNVMSELRGTAGYKDAVERVQRVCDSIEKDLKLSDSE